MEETKGHEAASTKGLRGWTEQRGWTSRTGKVQYRRYTAQHRDGSFRTFFEFTLAAGKSQLDPAIYAVMKEHQTYGDGYPSGLTSKKGGTLWYLPEHERNRALSDRIDMALQEVASKLELEPDRSR
jgi:hypothetical protein